MAKTVMFRALVIKEKSQGVERGDIVFVFRGEKGLLIADEMLKIAGEGLSNKDFAEHLKDCRDKLAQQVLGIFYNELVN